MTYDDSSKTMTQAQISFLQSYISGVAGHHLPMDGFPHTGGLFDSLSRKEEQLHPHRDQWGNWEGSFGEAFRSGQLMIPYRDEQIMAYAREFRASHPDIQAKNKYPDGHSFALCITHDTDNINYYPNPGSLLAAASRYLRCGLANPEAIKVLVLKAVKDMLYNRGSKLALRDINRFVEIEDSLGFRSTFYLFSPFLPHPHYYDSWYRISDEVLFRGTRTSLGKAARTIHQEGWDIGLHGSYHSAIEAGVLKREKESLEKALGFEVKSSRQHWLHFDINKTPYLHQEAGFTSDSTLGFNRFPGFRSSVAHPHKLWDSREDQAFSTWQIPLNLMDGTLFYGNSLELSEDMAITQSLELMERVASLGGVFTINWHPDHLNKEKFFRVYTQILKQAAKLNAWGCSAAQLADHWEANQPYPGS
jgi:peptidoglycan/xylan/chitin deacetylase (PgdA/CDA1 family)